MNPSRLEKINKVVAARQLDVAVLLENIHDFHNVNAVIRSCDAVGIQHVYLLYSNPELRQNKMKLGKRSTAGSRKWIDAHLYFDMEECVDHLKSSYGRFIGTLPVEESKSLYDVKLTDSFVLVMGNEKHGISEVLKHHLDTSIYIPMYGMVSSLNLSVACAICMYEMLRQRTIENGYNNTKPDPNLLAEYLERAKSNNAGKQPLIPNI